VKNTQSPQTALFEDPQIGRPTRETALFDTERLACLLQEASHADDLVSLRRQIRALKSMVTSPKSDGQGLLKAQARSGGTTALRKDVLLSELDQVLEARTLQRAQYYVKRLEKAVLKPRISKVSDMNLTRWKEYDEVITDSLWVLPKRDNSGAHLAWYWGNFIPQIPHQMMLRYTKAGDWILDAFVGSGTTLIECRKLGRNGIGIELNPQVAQKAQELISREPNRQSVITEVEVGDNRTLDVKSLLARHGIQAVQLLIMHPPYHDIIRFSEDEQDLSNAKDTEAFLRMFGEGVENVGAFLEAGRYFALVIGDKYSNGEWIPLGFYCMNEVLKRGFALKSIIVKNFDDTRGKRNQKELWRYRALVGGFYIFKHEYVMVFRKQ
jgi:hypothetical protein